jgi:NTP pyrophosphatase (non-canonical NTP hydrolase)
MCTSTNERSGVVDTNEKREFMREVESQGERAAAYQEGYADGASDGFDRGVMIARKIVMRHAIGGGELKPATKYAGLSYSQQLAKIEEEFGEVIEAYTDGEPQERLAEELVDLQTACETMLVIMGYDETARKNIRQMVADKNTKRGYTE